MEFWNESVSPTFVLFHEKFKTGTILGDLMVVQDEDMAEVIVQKAKAVV